MMQRRFQITCPHCRRSYALHVDPENLAQASATGRCGRCNKRFRLAAAIASSMEKASEAEEVTHERSYSPARGSYRRRISRPAMRAVSASDSDELRPGAMVDEIAVAFERALAERRHLDKLTTGDDRRSSDQAAVAFDGDQGAGGEASIEAVKRRVTPRVAFRFTPPPVARDFIFGGNLGALDDTTPRSELPLQGGEEAPSEPRPRSSSPPRPRDPRLPVEAVGVRSDAMREAWLSLADEPLELLIPHKSESVIALEWLLAEDALRGEG